MISIVWRYLVWDADLRGIGVGAKIFDKNFSQTGVQLSVGSACCTPPSVVHKTHVCSKLSCCSKFYIYFIGAADQGVPCAVLLNQRNGEMAGANPRFFSRFSDCSSGVIRAATVGSFLAEFSNFIGPFSSVLNECQEVNGAFRPRVSTR